MARALVETGFLLALNPRDRNHEWALKLLEGGEGGAIELYVSPAAPVEVSLILGSRGLSEREIREALEAMEDAMARFTKPRYVELRLDHAALAAELRRSHPELSFFDSLHAAVAIAEGLAYYDLDDVVRRAIEEERKKRRGGISHRERGAALDR